MLSRELHRGVNGVRNMGTSKGHLSHLAGEERRAKVVFQKEEILRLRLGGGIDLSWMV